MSRQRAIPRTLLAALGVVALAISGCGNADEGVAAGPSSGESDAVASGQASSSTDTTPGETTGAAAQASGGGSDLATAETRLAEITSELEGLDAAARRERLIELADEEGGAVNAYGSTNLDTSGPLIDDFEEATGIDVNFYRASSSDVLQRVLSETDANYAGSDVVFVNGTDMVVLDREGVLAPLETPVRDELLEDVRYDKWLGFYVNAFTAGWNTDAVTDPPTTWKQLLTEFDGRLAMEAGDWDWFAAMVQYFEDSEGMSEEEAIGLFETAAGNIDAVVDGHTLMAQLLAAGEYDAATSMYTVNTRQLVADGAPLAWEPPIQPLVLRPNGIALNRYATHPATALLFLEYMLTDGQERLPEFKREPVNTNVEGGLGGDYETVSVDLDDLLDNRDKWDGIYQKLVESSGKQAIEN